MENFEAEIEKSVYGGAGLAHLNGRAVFIENTVPMDFVKGKIVSKNKNYLKGVLLEVINPSPRRIKPECPLINPCGACDFGFCDYDYQTFLKNEILKEIFQSFKTVEYLPFIKSPKVLNYRHKTAYPICETQKSKRILAGYYKKRSHDIINIKHCPAQPPVLGEVIQFVRENWTFGCYNENKHQGLLRGLNIRISKNLNEILPLFVLNADENEFQKLDLKHFSNILMNKFSAVKGVSVNLNNKKTNAITGDKTFSVAGRDFIYETLGNARYKIGANSFFQINPYCAELLFCAAGDLIGKKGALLDLYGGLGAIGIFLKDKVTKITLVEENSEAVRFAKENYKLNDVKNYEVYENDAKIQMKSFIKEKKFFENIIFDPPRKGSDVQTLEFAAQMTNSVIYISCNPMTLKRDAEVLINKGFTLRSIRGADMFPNTHHIECVAHFLREK